MYNVGPGGWVLVAAALMVRVIYQGCAAVLIRKVGISKALRACRRPCNYFHILLILKFLYEYVDICFCRDFVGPTQGLGPI